MRAPKKEVRKLKLLIIDDHKVVRDGLQVMFHSLDKDFVFQITEAENSRQALTCATRDDFDLVIIDYQLPDISGAETVVRMLRFKPDLKIVALSQYDGLPYIQSMEDAGARGYILKNVEQAEMLRMIKTVLAGDKYYCSEVAVKLFAARESRELQPKTLLQQLTARELEVLRNIAMGMNNKTIAEKMSLSKRTIDTHRQNLRTKLQANTAGMLSIAHSMGLFKKE